MARWRAVPPTGDEVSRVLIERSRQGFDHVTFTGGEPTSRRLLPQALEAARKLGMKTYVTTNGGLFADDAYARAVLPLLDEMCLSVHGPDARTHDACARTPGSFRRAMRALDNISRFGPRVFLLTNTVAVRSNWARLPETLGMLAAQPAVRHCLVSNAAPEGRASRSYKRLAVPLGAWRERIPELAAVFAGSKTALRFFGLPLCVLGGRTDLSNDAHFSGRVTVERRSVRGEAGLAAIVGHDASRGRSYAPACTGCSAKDTCPGVFSRYLEAFGPEGLEALP